MILTNFKVDYSRSCVCGVDHIHPVLLEDGSKSYYCGECDKHYPLEYDYKLILTP